MWRITGRDNAGLAQEVLSLEIEDATRASIAGAFRQVMGGRPSELELFEKEISQPDPLPGVDGVEFWGPDAERLIGADKVWVDQTSERLYPLRRLQQLRMRESGSSAFHYPEALVMNVSGIRDLEIEVDPWNGDPDERLLLEARIYSNEGVIELESEAEPSHPRFRLRLHGYRTGLIARIAQLAGRPFSSARDPFMAGRLRHYENRYAHIAKAYPDITPAETKEGADRTVHKAPAGTAVIVFVHGTFACAIPNLALLAPGASTSHVPLRARHLRHDPRKC